MKQRKRRKLKAAGRIYLPQLSALDGSSESPLHAAAWAGDVERARELIAAGFSPSLVDSAGETPLHGAAAWGHVRMVELLLKAGAPVNHAAAATQGFTALHWAAGWGNLDTVKALLAAVPIRASLTHMAPARSASPKSTTATTSLPICKAFRTQQAVEPLHAARAAQGGHAVAARPGAQHREIG